MHTIVVDPDKKRFFCHNLAADFPDGAPIEHLGLNKEGQPSESGSKCECVTWWSRLFEKLV